MKLIIAVVCLFFSVTINADDQTKNYCHDPKNKKEFADLLSKNANDDGVIKLYALRDGLCGMIDDKKISLEKGIDLWELERSKIVIERLDDAKKNELMI